VQKSFSREREEPICLYISFLSSQYSLHSSNRCVGVCTAVQSLKHLPSFSFPIVLEKDLKKPFLIFSWKRADCSLLGYLSLGALKEKG